MSRLKPCPFCGKIPTRKHAKNCNGVESWWICCENERCLFQPMTKSYTHKGEDSAAWNTRAKLK